MGYRLPDTPPDRRKHITDLSMQSVITIDNGTISRISIPCFYGRKGHRKVVHDHFGWPSPDHPDDSCQLPDGYDRVLVVNEIDLVGEGYDSVTVSLLDPPEGLVASGTIDYDIVSITFTSMCPSAETEDVDVKFAVYVTGEASPGYDDTTTIQLRDVITKGVLHIVAGPIS